MRRETLLVVVAFVALLAVGVGYFAFRREAEPVLARDGPVVAFRIDLEAPAGAEILHSNWPAPERRSLDDPVRREVLAALHDRENFRSGSIKCFSPGMAFRFGAGANAVDALVCLQCDNVYFFRVADVRAYKRSMLSAPGHEAFLRVYRAIFGEPTGVAGSKSAK